jgi:hypothetical protein
MRRAIVVALLLVASTSLWGQDSVPPTGGGFCFRGRPKPKCSSFLITEFSTRRPLGALPDVDPIMDIQLGVMVNTGRRSAIGAILTTGGSESDRTTGFGVRYRRWLSHRLAGEIEGRVISVCEPSGPSSCDKARGGFAVESSLNLSDYVGASVTYQHVNAGSGTAGGYTWWSYPAMSQWSAGMKVGSYATPVVVLGLGVLIAATW